jgi:hypothetical protein
MGFFDFVNKIGSGFKSAISTVGNGLKSATVGVYDKALKPIYKKVIEPAYKKIIKPVGERAIKFVSHSIDRVEDIADAGVKGIESGSNLLDTISKSPMIIMVAIGAGLLLALR